MTSFIALERADLAGVVRALSVLPQRRGRGRPKGPDLSKAERNERIFTMRRQGITLQAIARELNLGVSSVANICARHKVKREGKLVHNPLSLVWTKLQDRNAEMCELRRQGKTLQEIGDKFNITRERVRQLCDKFSAVKPPPPQQWPIPGFNLRMRRWLWAAGYRKCYGGCGLWSCGITNTNTRCRACNAALANQYYHEHGGKERMKNWRQKNIEKAEAQCSRYYDRLKATPEGQEILRQRQHKAYEKLISTEEGRERARRYAREAYARRRAKQKEHIHD